MNNETKKYCPLSANYDEVLHCYEGNCAWWDEDAQACSMLVLAKAAKKVSKNAR